MQNIISDLDLSNINTLGDLIVSRIEKTPLESAVNYYIDEKTIKCDTWQDVYNKSLSLSAYINLLQAKKIGIFLPTSYSWMLLDNACLLSGLTSLVYHSAWLAPELSYAISLDVPDIIICTKDLKTIIEQALNILSLDILILVSDEQRSEINNIIYNNKILQYALDKSKFILAKSIAFTSGTSGLSKGVILTQKSILASAKEAYQTVNFNALNSNMFHWMPLSHVFARVGLYISLMCKGNNYFLRSVNYFSQDLKLARPSILFAVPKLMSKMQQQIKLGITKKHSFMQKFINLFEQLGYIWQKLPTPLNLHMQKLQRKLFKPLHEQFGNNLKLLVVGGASICKTQKQFFEAIGIRICEGYGMTETSGVVAVQPYNTKNQGSGKFLPSVKTCLSKNNELLIKGDMLLEGYLPVNDYKLNDWLNTGDVVKIENGYLSITGRTKEIIITKNGENIHPVKIENLLQMHDYIEDSCIVGDNQNSLLALIVVKKQYNQQQNLTQEIKLHLSKINKDLPRFEKIFDYIIVPSFIENKLVTITHKKRRNSILSYHAEEINNFYIKKNI